VVLLVFAPAADAEDVAVGVADVHFADIPFHVGRWKGHIESLVQTTLVDGVNVVDPDRHPDALIGSFAFPESVFPPLPRPPWPPSHRKIWHSPEQTPPKVGSSPQPQLNSQPSFSNHSTLDLKSETFNIGVSPFAFIRES